MDKILLEKFIEDYNASDMVLIGVGSQLNSRVVDDSEQLRQLLQIFGKYLDKKNYFIITTLQDDMFIECGYNRRRVVRPILAATDEEESKQWELYNKWLAATLNKKLMIIELGEDFNRPNIFRWPFENVVFINQKSCMYRVHDVFYQLPENIKERATSVKLNAFDFIKQLSVLLNIPICGTILE